MFLLTLASGRRRSEVHAIVHKGINYQWDENHNQVYHLPVHADFIAKNQLSSKGVDVTKVILIPSLKEYLGPDLWLSEDRYLCPVRALKYYLEASLPLRQGRSRLFIPVSPGVKSELCSSTISSYLVQTIDSIYKQENLFQKLRKNGVNVKAHQIRSCSASWAFLKGKVGMDQIMNACFWRSHTTFTSHYLKHYWTLHDDELYTITPFVAAGSVIDPAIP